MKSMQAISDFMSVKNMAIAGVSRDQKKFGFMVFKELKKRGYTLYPINPNTDFIGDIQCFQSVLELPAQATNLYIVTPKEITAQIMRDAVTKGIHYVWIQQKSETPEALAIANENGIKLISGECIFMFMKAPEGFHKFHRFLRRIFGGIPQ
jgi:uncharacterized protein